MKTPGLHIVWFAVTLMGGAVVLGTSAFEVLERARSTFEGGPGALLNELQWVLLIPLNAIVGLYSVRMPRRQEILSAGDVILFILATHFGPEQAAIAASIEGAMGSSGRGSQGRLRRALFNASTLGIAYYVSGHLFFWVAGLQPGEPLTGMGMAVVGLAVLVAVKYAINVVLILGIMVLPRPQAERGALLRGMFPVLLWTGGTELIGAVLACASLMLTGIGIWVWWSLLGILVLGWCSMVLLRHYFGQLEMQVAQSSLAEERASLAEERAALAEERASLTLQTMHALAAAIEARDPSTLGHGRRVAAYAEVLAPDLDLAPVELEALKIAATLHDVGKLGISDFILSKQGPLDERERLKLQSHPEIGAQIVQHLTVRGTGADGVEREISLAELVLRHHERYDGQGYPGGLKGEEIPRLARILACLESYDELLFIRKRHQTGRDNPQASPPDTALLEFQLESGRSLEPGLVALTLARHQALQAGAREKLMAERVSETAAHFANIIADSQREMERLFDSVHRLTGSQLKVAEVLETLTRNVEQVAPKAIIIAYVLEEGSDSLEVESVVGFQNRSVLLERRSLKVSSSFAGRCVTARKLQRGRSAVADVRMLSEELADRCAGGAIFPLVVEQVVGVIGVYYEEEGSLSEDNVRVVEDLCRLTAPALQNAQFRHQAFTDGLTGLTNNRHLMRHGEQVLKSGEEPMAVLMMDLDGFKAINDTYGHDVGDRILIEVARALMPLFDHGAGEMLSRKGGDEFVAILMDTDRAEAEERVARIRKAVAQVSIEVEHEQQRVVAQVGVSVGVACAPEDSRTRTLTELLRVADMRMYKDKRAGKQKRVWHEDLPFVQNSNL